MAKLSKKANKKANGWSKKIIGSLREVVVEGSKFFSLIWVDAVSHAGSHLKLTFSKLYTLLLDIKRINEDYI